MISLEDRYDGDGHLERIDAFNENGRLADKLYYDKDGHLEWINAYIEDGELKDEFYHSQNLIDKP